MAASGKDQVKIILVMGKSGSGKQPRIDCLAEEFGFKQISTGNLFRECIGTFNSIGFEGSLNETWDEEKKDFKDDAVIVELLKQKSKTPDVLAKPETNMQTVLLGCKAKYFVESGLFVPDTLTHGIFANAFESYFAAPLESCGSARRGLILDGFPRTIGQAEFLLELLSKHSLKVDFILEVDLDDETIVKRTTGRRICPGCQSVFHLMFKPPRDGQFCTKCGAVVKQRADDATEDLLRRRLNEFATKVAPCLAFLKEKGIPVVTVPGNLPDPSPAAVKESVMGSVSKLWQ
ncbi:adenylate kinase [Monocercomonoides exilis]|uniref:adenylate kinase n=1 Tax=Monocercomonoides exilis TaxID=2049356 RepID=UPI00355AAA4C|nr:adenylate kinase [Monocercomonoides exilis]|eukprot:MONOS_6701.1-p1 / transcript=MONOS_6701.1 / gene=MONOS_6701 / organism=Monocercomonoides_exilis_PA203 / gene_product=adenylate kinase [EC:2.7.4.3] / transcript_product=adenylate kinase [EC:2.7.4.3] / location=Mono_scaffold00216:13636-14625(-) / protein_length=290 / sequence_SO=supercontig / SO=protein_coding / is_pseudo=false